MPIAAALIPLAIGAGEAVVGGIQRSKALKAAQKAQVPTIAPSKSINDFYQQALNRATAGAYNSQYYQQQLKGLNTGLGAGLNSLQNRRSAVGNVGALVGQYQAGQEKAGANAEQMQSNYMRQLGQATGMQSADVWKTFNQNAMLPFQKDLQLNYAKAAGAAQMMGTGLQNVNQGAQNYMGLKMMQQNGAIDSMWKF